MDKPERNEEIPNSGQWLWKTLKPAGCIFVLVLCVLALWILFTNGADPIPGYEPPESMEYYAENTDELLAELEANVLPHIEGVADCAAEGGKVRIELEYDAFVPGRSILLRYFDEELFSLVQREK